MVRRHAQNVIENLQKKKSSCLLFTRQFKFVIELIAGCLVNDSRDS